LVAAGDETALFEAINFMLDNCEMFDRSQIRKSAIEIFSKQAVADKLAELYKYALH
jgi:glycosyltransferase involved in cell wall biosynthesis